MVSFSVLYRVGNVSITMHKALLLIRVRLGTDWLNELLRHSAESELGG